MRLIVLPRLKAVAIEYQLSAMNMKALRPEERILTLHPGGKHGVRILRSRYDLMYNTLLGIFAEYPEITHKKLSSLSEDRLHGLLGGSIPWLMETVKLDMLARGIIEKTSDTPVKLRLGTR